MNFYRVYFSTEDSHDNWITVKALNPVHAVNRGTRLLSENYSNYKIEKCEVSTGPEVVEGRRFVYMNETFTWVKELHENLWLCENTRNSEDAYFQLNGDSEVELGPMTIEEVVEHGLLEDIQEDAKPMVEGPAFGMASVLNSLIVDEYEAIEGYNTAIATAKAEGFDDIVKILTDIQAEEQIHVGQLQRAMQQFDPNAAMVQDGVEEASQQLESSDDLSSDDAQGLIAAYDTVQQKGNTYNEV